MFFNPPFQPEPLQTLPEDFTTLLESCPTRHASQESIIPDLKSSHGDYSADGILPEGVAELIDHAPIPEPEPVVKKGRRRKYAHLAHLSSDEYRKATNRLHVADSLKRHRADLRHGAATIEIIGDHSVEMGLKLENKYPRADDEYEPVWVAYDAWRTLCVNRDQLVRQFRAVLAEHTKLETSALDDLNAILKERKK